MKIVATIIAAAALIAGLLYLSRTHGPGVERMPSAQPNLAQRAGPAEPAPAATPGAVPAPAAMPATPAAPGVPDRPPAGDFDPMLVMALGDFSDEEIARYNDLHILPFNKAVGQQCEELPAPNFVDRTMTVCKTVRELPEHPYAQLDTHALMELAVDDATAALFLGRRVKEEQERLRWYLRAAALSGKSGPLVSLAENRYGSMVALKTVNGEKRPVVQLDKIATRIALDTVAAKMGDPRANPQRWREMLQQEAGTDAQTYLTRADALTTEFLHSMALIQRDVTGSVQIQEIIDNA